MYQIQRFKSNDIHYSSMKYKHKDKDGNYEDIELEDKDFLMITAIDNLTTQLIIRNNKNG